MNSRFALLVILEPMAHLLSGFWLAPRHTSGELLVRCIFCFIFGYLVATIVAYERQKSAAKRASDAREETLFEEEMRRRGQQPGQLKPPCTKSKTNA